MTSPLLQGLPPIIDARTQVLILGSFPSVASLEAGRYYAHSRNQFWRILSQVLACPLQSMSYREIQTVLGRAGLGIWDVYGRCRRQGSLDSAIQDGEPNDFQRLSSLAPHLERICFNGSVAGKFAPRLDALGYETLLLPSTSPAYTLAFEQKQERWQEALAPVLTRKISPARCGTRNTG